MLNKNIDNTFQSTIANLFIISVQISAFECREDKGFAVYQTQASKIKHQTT